MHDRFLIQPLSSGSKGNSILLRIGASNVLVDAGQARVELIRRLHAVGLAPEDLSAIVLTHCHSDHTRGAGPLARRFKVPVHATPFCADHLKRRMLPKLVDFDPNTPFELAGACFEPFRVSHDVPETVGFRVSFGERSIGLCTDLGSIGGSIQQKLRDCDVLYLEFNHDPSMLREGPYPWPLKKRILSPKGHLSNEQAAQLLREIATPRLRHLFLAHLSLTNNRPELALDAARTTLLALSLEHVGLCVALQDAVTEPVDLGETVAPTL